jgi:hypothetical protein
MILNHQERWDHEALTEVLSYRSTPRQAWYNTHIGGPWPNLMRNALNSQIWSFSARIAEIVLRDERAVVPIGVHHQSLE